MRETFNIDNFDAGLVSNPDMQDVPQNAAVYSKNVDPDVSDGVLQSIKKPTTIGTIADDAKRSVWLQQDSTKYDLVYLATSDYPNSVTDFYGATPADSQHDTTACTSLAVNNKEVHIGRGTTNTPKWLGYISYGQFGGSAPSGLQFLDAAVVSNAGTSAGKVAIPSSPVYNLHAAVDSDYFQYGKNVAYKLSCVYDGYQESPLTTTTQAPVPLSDGQSADYSTIIVKVYGIASFPKRVSAVNVYRSEYDSTGFGEYRLIRSIDINDASWATSGSDKTFTFTDTGTFKYTYFTSTGIAETLESTTVNYTLSTIVNGYLVVGNCYQSSLGTQDRVLFRSKYLRYDTFDWVNDQLRLPFVPKAMAGFNGRLYVWGQNKTVIIEPESFQIENIFEGIGCYSDKSFVVTDYGLFWADKNGAYLTTGENPKMISSPIREKQFASGVSWNDIFGSLATDSLSVAFSSQKKLVIFCESLTGKAFTFHLPKRRWDYWELSNPGSTANSSVFSGKDGELYYSNGKASGAALYKLLSSSSYESLLWHSIEFAPDPSQNKKFYKIITDGNNVTTTYDINGGTSGTSLTNSELQAAHRKAKSLQFRVETTSANTVSQVYSIGVVYRQLEGKR